MKVCNIISNMKIILATIFTLQCCISGTTPGIVAPGLGTNYIRTPQYDVAQVRNYRSGRAFAYSTIQHHAYQAVPTIARPVVAIPPPIVSYSPFYPLGYSSFIPYYPSYFGGLGGFGGGFYPGFGAGGYYPGSSYQSSQFSSNTNDNSNVNVNVDNSASAVSSDSSQGGLNGGVPFSENGGDSTFSDTSGSESSYSENSGGTLFTENSHDYQQSQDDLTGPSGFDDSDSVAVDSERKK